MTCFVAAKGQIMHYNMRIGQNSGKFEKKYDQEKLTNGGYITAKLNQK